MPDTSYKLRSGRLDWRLVDGEVIALDLERAEYLAINPSGAELWPLLVEGATRDQLVRRLQDTFAIDEAQARGDVDAFVAGLESQQLLDSAD